MHTRQRRRLLVQSALVTVGLLAPLLGVSPAIAETASAADDRFVVAAALDSPKVDATASLRKIAEKVHVAVTAVNRSTVPAQIDITTAFGKKSFNDVPPGKTVSAVFTSTRTSIPSGTATVTATATIGGKRVSSTVEASYTVASQAAVAPAGTGANQEIRNQQNTLCLDDFAFDTRPGAEVRQWTCLEGQNQLWAVGDLGNGYAEIKNTHSNLCLDNRNAAMAAGADVRQWTCNSLDTQQWKLTDAGGGWIEIRNKFSGLCLQSVASPVDGGVLSQQTCDGSGVQRWRLTDPTVSKVTWSLERVANPDEDQRDAYERITVAMDQAVARWNKLANTWRHLTVRYDTNVETAEAWGSSGLITFGGNRHYMQEGTALHEMNHAFGGGTSSSWGHLCDNQLWPSALPLLKSFDGPDAVISCGSGGIHWGPYGLNYSQEFSETAFDRNVRIIQAMHHDGL